MKIQVYPTDSQWSYFEEQLIHKGYLKPNGQPIRCACGSIHLGEIMTDVDEAGYINEYNIVCNNCGERVAIWAYGSFYPDRENYKDIIAEVIGPMTSIKWAWGGLIRRWLQILYSKDHG